MMRLCWPVRGLTLLGVVALAVAACTSTDPLPVPPPVEVETCDELVDVSVQLFEVWVDVLDELPVEQLTADEPPPEFVELAAIGDDLDARASRLGCDAVEMNAAVQAEMADTEIEAPSVVVELLLDIVTGGVVGDLPPASAPTSTTEASS